MTAINGKKIYNYREILLYMQAENPSKPVTLSIEHADGSKESVVVTPKVDKEGNYNLELLEVMSRPLDLEMISNMQVWSFDIG